MATPSDAQILQSQHKFQSVPKRLEKRLRSASLEQLEAWLRRLMTAESLDSVFKVPAKG